MKKEKNGVIIILLTVEVSSQEEREARSFKLLKRVLSLSMKSIARHTRREMEASSLNQNK